VRGLRSEISDVALVDSIVAECRRKSMLTRILLAAGVSWIYSVSLGLLYAACASGHFDLRTLWLPGVIPVAMLFSTVVSIGITPIAVWSLRTGKKNLYIYGPILWIILATRQVGVSADLGASRFGGGGGSGVNSDTLTSCVEHNFH
jgi:hypothetical protein